MSKKRGEEARVARVGETLRSARVERRLSLERVERDTRIRLAYLEALENGQYASLPAPVYARGYLRTYAQYLGLDPALLLTWFNEECDVAEPQGVQSESKIGGGGLDLTPRPFIALGMVALAVVLALFLYQQYDQFVGTSMFGQGPDSGPVAMTTPVGTETVFNQPTPTLTPTPSPTATPTPIPSVTIEVKVVERCWVEVTVDGEVVYSGTLQVGETKSWTGQDKITMRAGYPNGVEITLNGEYLGRLAPYGSQPGDFEWKATPR